MPLYNISPSFAVVVADNDTESILYFFKEFTGKDIFKNAGIDNIQ